MQQYPLLQAKLYIPPVRPELVPRPRLIERLNAGLDRKLTLISAPAGFDKSTLVSEWVLDCGRPVGWLSLDEGDNDFAHFVTHFIAALQRVKPGLGETVLAVFQSPQRPPVEAVLASLINEIASLPERLTLVLDDYHVIRSSTNQALGFMLERLPLQLHLVIVTRRDPHLPLALLRARGQMTEIRYDDLHFTREEAVLFLNQAMGLALTPEEVAPRLSHVVERDLLSHIAVIRARIALADQDLSAAVKLARQALEYLPARHLAHGHIAAIEGQAAFSWILPLTT